MRLMPLGDSVTAGSPDEDTNRFGPGTHGGYRLPLWNLLRKAGYPLRFVGVETDGPITTPPWDRGHCGIKGFRIKWLEQGVSHREKSGSLQEWIPHCQPHVILLLVGYNDLWDDPDSQTVKTLLANLENTIDRITCLTDAHLLVGSVTPMFPDGPDVDFETQEYESTRQYNAGIPPLVTRYRARGHKIDFVDLYSAFDDPAHDVYSGGGTRQPIDNKHVGGQGYVKMARAWFDALLPLLKTSA